MMGHDQNYPRITIERGIEEDEWVAIAFCYHATHTPRPLGDRTFLVVATDKSMLGAIEKLIDLLIEDESVSMKNTDSLRGTLKGCVPYHNHHAL